ncbi:MAG: hypothetical protein KDK66_00790 [Deltaproteobacteria bacterium]|nr:hypothetical protein [Deltaproteobacteria bacterium]
MKKINQVYKNQSGFAVIAAALSLALLGLMVLGSTTLVSTSNKSKADTDSRAKVEAYLLAGQEYAIREINQGRDPTVTNQAIGGGSFSVSVSYPTITVSASYDIATATRSFDTNFAADCVSFTCNPLSSSGKRLYGLELNKSCLDTPTLTHFQVDAMPYSGEAVTEIMIEGQKVWEDWAGVAAGTMLDIDDISLPPNPATTANVDYIQFYSPLELGQIYIFYAWFADSSFTMFTCVDSQSPGPGESGDPTEGFNVNNGKIELDPGYQITFEVLCADMAYPGDGGDMELRSRLIRNEVPDADWLFGSGPLMGGESQTESNTSTGIMIYALEGNSKYQKVWDFSALSTNQTQIRTLVDGNFPTPYLEGFGGSQAIEDCLSPYIDRSAQEVDLAPNEILIMHELGVDYSKTSEEGNFQDLILKATVNPIKGGLGSFSS